MDNGEMKIAEMMDEYRASRAAIYKWEKTRPDFPKRIKYGPRVGRWIRAEVEAHIAGIKAAREENAK